MVYSRAGLFGNEDFVGHTNRLFDFNVPYAVPQSDTVPKDWGNRAIPLGHFVYRKPEGMTKSTMLNLVKGNKQTALVLEVRKEHEFVIQEESKKIELAETLPVEAITLRGEQVQINDLVMQILKEKPAEG